MTALTQNKFYSFGKYYQASMNVVSQKLNFVLSIHQCPPESAFISFKEYRKHASAVSSTYSHRFRNLLDDGSAYSAATSRAA
jgi:hypothetical protein